MDLMTSLPQQPVVPRTEHVRAADRPAGRRAQEDSRGDGAEALSFQGILENSREIPQKTHGQNDQPNEKQGTSQAPVNEANPQAVPSANEASVGSEGGAQVSGVAGGSAELNSAPVSVVGQGQSVMIEQMVKSMLGLGHQGVPAVAITPDSAQAQTVNLTEQSGAAGQENAKHPALADLVPTGNNAATGGKAQPNLLANQTPVETGQMVKPEAGAKTVETSAAQQSKPALPNLEPQTYSGTELAKTLPEVKNGPALDPAIVKTAQDAPGQMSAAQVAQTKVLDSAASQAAVPEQAAVQAENTTAKTIISELEPTIEADIADEADVALNEAMKMTGQEGSTSQENKDQENQDQAAPLLAAVETFSSSNGQDSIRTPSTRNLSADLQVQAQKIRGQVVRELSSRLDGRIGQEKITLTLNPEKLGQVEIQFLAKDNDLSVVITASNGETEQAIRDGVKDLADGIADKSGRWNQVEIKVDQRGHDQDKNDTKQESKRDSNKKDEQGRQQQQNKNQSQDGAPDWASLVSEG